MSCRTVFHRESGKQSCFKHFWKTAYLDSLPPASGLTKIFKASETSLVHHRAVTQCFKAPMCACGGNKTVLCKDTQRWTHERKLRPHRALSVAIFEALRGGTKAWTREATRDLSWEGSTPFCSLWSQSRHLPLSAPASLNNRSRNGVTCILSLSSPL